MSFIQIKDDNHLLAQMNKAGEYRFKRKDNAWQMYIPTDRDVKADKAEYFPVVKKTKKTKISKKSE